MKQIAQPLRDFYGRSPSLSAALAKRTGNISILKQNPSFFSFQINMDERGNIQKKMRLYFMTFLSPKEEIIRSKCKFTLLFIVKRTREKQAAI